MDIFESHRRIMGDFASYIRSFIFIADNEVRKRVAGRQFILSSPCALAISFIALHRPDAKMVARPLSLRFRWIDVLGLERLKGVFGTFRNMTAHAPKIRWTIEEQDALDFLTRVSYLHRLPDWAVKVIRS